MMLFCPWVLEWLRVCGCVQKQHQVPCIHSVWVAPGPQVSFLGASVSLASSGLSGARGGITQALETVSGHHLDTAWEGQRGKAVSSWP